MVSARFGSKSDKLHFPLITTVNQVSVGYSRSPLYRHSSIVCAIVSCLVSLTSGPRLPPLTPYRGGALQPRQSV